MLWNTLLKFNVYNINQHNKALTWLNKWAWFKLIYSKYLVYSYGRQYNVLFTIRIDHICAKI